jgi:hypothetical protein
MSRWFRHYAGMMRDDKLVRVSLKCKQPVERVLWIWGAILESAAELNADGRFSIEPAEVARFLDCDIKAIRSIIKALDNASHTNDGKIVRWNNRQFKSDRSAERVAKHRANVTLLKRHRNAPETETETETDRTLPIQDRITYQVGDTREDGTPFRVIGGGQG